MKGNKKSRAHASDLIPTKIVEGKTRKRKKTVRTPTVKRRPKKRADYNTRELFGKLAKTHQKIAGSLKNDKRQSAKRRYHEELAETFAFLAKKGNGEETQENGSINRIPPMFKGAIIMVMPDELKRLSRRINELEKENEKTRKY